MRYAIEVNFDRNTEEIITDLWKELKSAGLVSSQTKARPFIPHISLGVCEDLDENKAQILTKQIAGNSTSFPTKLAYWGIFNDKTNVLFLGIRDQRKLIELHAYFHQVVKPLKIDWWSYYLPENWIPHCSIMVNESLDEVSKALKICEKIKFPILSRVEKISLVDFKEGRDIAVYGFNELEMK